MKKTIEFYALSEAGKVRKENQDKIFVSKFSLMKKNESRKFVYFAVFDGMGGEQCGDIASQIAVDTLKAYEGTNVALDDLCKLINKRICRYMTENSINQMGTTAAIIRISSDTVTVCNIGDSKVYRINSSGLRKMSVDHTMAVGRMRPRRVLTQHLGIPEDEFFIEPYISSFSYSAGDKFLLCSDGLTDMVSEDDILEIVSNGSPEKSGRKLYELAMENGGRDNISIIICEAKNV